MAITPTEARGLLPEEAGVLADLEAKIDEALRREYCDDTRRVTFNLPAGASERVVAELIQRYRDAGWSVNLWSGRRPDPDWLEFRRPDQVLNG